MYSGHNSGHMVHTFPADKMIPRDEISPPKKTQDPFVRAWKFIKKDRKRQHTRKSRRYLKRQLYNELMEG